MSGVSTPLCGNRVLTEHEAEEETSGKRDLRNLNEEDICDTWTPMTATRDISSNYVYGSNIRRKQDDSSRSLYLSHTEGGGPNWRELPTGPLLRTFELLWALEWEDSCQRAASAETARLTASNDDTECEGTEDKTRPEPSGCKERRDGSLARCARVCRSWRAGALEVLLGDTAASRPARIGMTSQSAAQLGKRVCAPAGSEYTTLAQTVNPEDGATTSITDGEACSRPVRDPTNPLPAELILRQQQQQLRQYRSAYAGPRQDSRTEDLSTMNEQQTSRDGGAHSTQSRGGGRHKHSTQSRGGSVHTTQRTWSFPAATAAQAPSNEEGTTDGVGTREDGNRAQATCAATGAFSHGGLSQGPSGFGGQQAMSREFTSEYQPPHRTPHSVVEDACSA